MNGCRKFQQEKNLNNFTVLIPVFKETEALKFSKDYFSELGITPQYALDSKRKSRQAEVERCVGRAVPVFENPENCIEANFRRFAALSPTDWILRIDCDEVPSLAALSFANQFATNSNWKIAGFPRIECVPSGATLAADVTPGFQHFTKFPQYRLFNRKRVWFRSGIHTPGYYLPRIQKAEAPPQACLYHLEYVFTSEQERDEKQKRYEAAGQSGSQNDDFRKWQTRSITSLTTEPVQDETLATAFKRFRRR